MWIVFVSLFNVEPFDCGIVSEWWSNLHLGGHAASSFRNEIIELKITSMLILFCPPHPNPFFCLLYGKIYKHRIVMRLVSTTTTNIPAISEHLFHTSYMTYLKKVHTWKPQHFWLLLAKDSFLNQEICILLVTFFMWEFIARMSTCTLLWEASTKGT